MRDPFKEYRDGKLSWDEAYMLATNVAATTSSGNTTEEEVDYWCRQMESLAVDAANSLMKLLGYQENEDGVFFKPSNDK